MNTEHEGRFKDYPGIPLERPKDISPRLILEGSGDVIGEVSTSPGVLWDRPDHRMLEFICKRCGTLNIVTYLDISKDRLLSPYAKPTCCVCLNMQKERFYDPPLRVFLGKLSVMVRSIILKGRVF